MTIAFQPALERRPAILAGVRLYFETQRWILEKLFGRRGDDFERAKFLSTVYKKQDSSVILVDGNRVGWIAVARDGRTIHLDGIYLTASSQNRGIGTALLHDLMREAKVAGLPLTLSTAKINPAIELYGRLGFTTMGRNEYKLYMTWWPKGDLTTTPASETRC